MSNGGQKRSEHRGRSERGAALVETAIILPLIILITFGMIEFSMAYRDASSVADAARAGARTGSAQARNANFAINAANAVGSVLQGDVPSDSPIEVWIYKANTNGYPGGGTDFSSCTTNCISYQWDAATKTFKTSTPGGSGWVAATHNVCYGAVRPNRRLRADQSQVHDDVLRVERRADRSQRVPLRAGAERDMLVTGSRRRPPAPRARDNSEHGFILVWFAFMLIALLSVTALAIESNHWAHESRRVQKAADAAALGGSVFMPQNLGNIAYTTARELATKNGFTDGVNGVSVTVSPGARSNQLKVVISEPVTNLFGAIAGYPTTTVAKHAVAEYERPVALGSPTNQFGNDPTIVPAPLHGTPTYPDLWANVAGPKSEKNKGDATLANVCSAPGDHPDNCSNSSAGPNTDYNPKGYYYTIDVGPAASTPLVVQVFDPAFVHVGDNCGDDSDPAGGSRAAIFQMRGQLPANFNTGFPMTAADIVTAL